MLQGGLLNWFKGSLCELVQNQRYVPGGDTPSALGSVSVETVQETGEIFIFVMLRVGFPSLSAMADL